VVIHGVVKKTLSLRDRAIAYLARREHSRSELAGKLARHAEDPDEIPPLLDELVRRKLLSDNRYAEARVHALARRFGVTRIESELRAQGVDRAAIAHATRDARTTEIASAREAWRKRFGTPPKDALERARQMRFLRGRGFSYEAIRKAVGAPEED